MEVDQLTEQSQPSSRTVAASSALAPPRRILVVNAGSSSLKLRVLGGPGAESDEVTGEAELPAVGDAFGGGTGSAAIKAAIESFGPVDAVGHRVVHGGTLYTAPVLVTAGMLHIGPLADELRRHAHRQFGRQCEMLEIELRSVRVGGLSEQHREPVLRLRERLLEGWQGGLGLRG